MKVGITHGDFNGANYEILLKIFEDPRIPELFTSVIYGSPKAAGWYRKALNLPQVQLNIIDSAENAREGVVNMVNVTGNAELDMQPGKSTSEAGEAARKALEKAVADLKNGVIDVLVTAPINKDNVQSEKFNFPGHTEYLEKELANEENPKALMIMCSDSIRVALVTTHKPIHEIAASINEDVILEKLRIFSESLAMDFTLPHPKIAVLALNPHASDNGLLGTEERDIISPAIEKAQEEGIMAFGPYGADGFFGSGNYRNFDGILAMYHDQGLIPFKLLAMENGVNYTAGLPYVRTSPDHGTAYDIAGKGIAEPDSFRNAIYKAIDIYRHRQANSVLRDNPLPKLYNTNHNPKE